MKFLMLTKPDHGEYLSDMVLHSFRFSEHEIIDYPRSWYMYQEDLSKEDFEPVGKVSGNGFTLFGTLPKDDAVDRDDIKNKIINSYFDYIIFQRCDFAYDLEELIFEYYSNNKIILLDGHDVDYLSTNRINKGIYFKREYTSYSDKVYPISFAFPKEKINLYSEEKTKCVSDIIPGQTTLGTYKYLTEESYYREYSQSNFALTMKKSGWDCMRHYEIIANKCIPIFQNIEYCPDETMKTLPKELFLKVNSIINEKGVEWFSYNKIYEEMNEQIFNHFVDNCTTENLSKHILNIIGEIK